MIYTLTSNAENKSSKDLLNKPNELVDYTEWIRADCQVHT